MIWDLNALSPLPYNVMPLIIESVTYTQGGGLYSTSTPGGGILGFSLLTTLKLFFSMNLSSVLLCSIVILMALGYHAKDVPEP